MARFITSDWHLGEDRMTVMGRPFKTGDDCVCEMVLRHNALVQPDDEVIVVGDVCYQKRPDMLKWVAQFNGRKTLVKGNHDRGIPDEEFSKYFEKIVPDGEGIELEACGIQCYATHYPTQGKSTMFNLVGHIHAAWKYQLNMLNVGVDVHHFRPVDLDTIKFHFDAICQYYDEDVWVAYTSLNTEWRGVRGKPGSYFTKG